MNLKKPSLCVGQSHRDLHHFSLQRIVRTSDLFAAEAKQTIFDIIKCVFQLRRKIKLASLRIFLKTPKRKSAVNRKRQRQHFSQEASIHLVEADTEREQIRSWFLIKGFFEQLGIRFNNMQRSIQLQYFHRGSQHSFSSRVVLGHLKCLVQKQSGLDSTS